LEYGDIKSDKGKSMTFYKANPDGTKSSDVITNDINDWLQRVSAIALITGKKYTYKYFIESSDTHDTMALLKSHNFTNPYFIRSNAATETDLTGSEDKYGAMQVDSVSGDVITVVHGLHDLVRTNDYVLLPNGKIHQVTAITDNGGTWDLTVSPTPDDTIAGYIYSGIIESYTNGDDYSYYLIYEVPPNSDTPPTSILTVEMDIIW